MDAAVVKVGGSQARLETLPALCAVLAEAALGRSLLVVPGGGAWADVVREHAARFPLSDSTAHWMAILAMDQFGLLLADLTPGCRAVRSLGEARAAWKEGGAAVLLPHDWLRRADPLPHSWDVTSDSIAAWVAAEVEASLLVLLKDVDGLYEDAPGAGDAAPLESIGLAPLESIGLAPLESIGLAPLESIGLAALERSGGVDPHLASILKDAAHETWIVNGTAPHRLLELFDRGATFGTRVLRRG
ncbi:MAG: hypothetical protein AB7D51_15540 [Desulfovibrionaceae bacterium]